ncbi:short-chain fatty acid transporter [Thermaerobacter sp. PB12/4term]|uniref:short-chain fatty acid transporter n=1 Tax=Thermaerobacter sp. PB12/4term TaxID=2293838 RepID=UPI000E32C15A|nr:TIGR00366 family protein [Thermaerobacter sp. PB12/4term]QIA27674.1 short-chain fatty acid transporter [Thermaerobacter sp. PB12/4term]
MQRIGEALSRFTRRYLPDSFIFAILLTLVVYVMGLVFTDHGPYQLVLDWYGGFWNLLAFGMQMTLILVTGYALANTPSVRRGLQRLADWPRSAGQAVALVAFMTGLLGLINYGLSLVAGALLAIEVGRSCSRRGIKVHFPLLVAAGYIGLMIWHGGLSGSAPLTVNTPGHFLEKQMGLLPLTETLFRPFNVVVALVLLFLSPWIMARMHPAGGEVVEIPAALAGASGEGTAATAEPPLAPGAGGPGVEITPAERLERSRILTGLIVLAGVVYITSAFVQKGIAALDINMVVFIFLILGMLLHGTPIRYAQAIADGVRSASGVILQFPFYAGIMGIMTGSGLVAIIANWFVAISTPVTFPFWTFVSACLVNLAVPSGGGQWAVQGPIVIQAAQALHLDLGKAVMAVAFGDELTNMIQPFWALPLLGMTGLRAGQILGYTAVVMMVAFAVMALGLVFLP